MADLSKIPLTLEWAQAPNPRPVLRLQVTLDCEGRICGMEFSAIDVATIEAAARAAYWLGRRHGGEIAAPTVAGDRKEKP